MPSLMEVFGFITGAACVALLVSENHWNWRLGIGKKLADNGVCERTGLDAEGGSEGV